MYNIWHNIILRQRICIIYVVNGSARCWIRTSGISFCWPLGRVDRSTQDPPVVCCNQFTVWDPETWIKGLAGVFMNKLKTSSPSSQTSKSTDCSTHARARAGRRSDMRPLQSAFIHLPAWNVSGSPSTPLSLSLALPHGSLSLSFSVWGAGRRDPSAPPRSSSVPSRSSWKIRLPVAQHIADEFCQHTHTHKYRCARKMSARPRIWFQDGREHIQQNLGSGQKISVPLGPRRVG